VEYIVFSIRHIAYPTVITRIQLKCNKKKSANRYLSKHMFRLIIIDDVPDNFINAYEQKYNF